MLAIQEFLRSQPLFRLENYHIIAKRHNTYPNLVLFKYDQTRALFSEKIVRECRGIILDEADDWKVVSMAFEKFFNYGEWHAATIDWSTARVQEKVDGSLCVLYFYDGAWQVATSGTPDASGPVHGNVGTFKDYFWETFNALGMSLPNFTRRCYYFELSGPLNRVVIVHDTPKLVLLGARHLTTLKEISSPVMDFDVWPEVVREYPLQSFEDIAASFATMSPLSQEGYVVVDAAHNRVKVKHPGYVALHHAKDGMTEKAFMEIVRNGETSEVLVAFPEFRALMTGTKERYEALATELEADYARLRDIHDQKAFALEAVKTRCSSALFCVRAGKVPDIRAFLADMRIDNLLDLTAS